MQILNTSFKKRKAKKPNAKQRELDASWEALKKKYATKTVVTPKQQLSDVYSLKIPAGRETPKILSLNGGVDRGCATLKPNPVYTGNNIKGIGTMHKSNAVPIFTDEQAVEIATMRRG